MRKFEVPGPQIVWPTDITYLRTLEGGLYLSVVLDLLSRRVVGYAISNRIRSQLVLQTLDHAVVSRPGARDVLIHSDRGSQFTSVNFREALDDSKLIPSMNRRGNCWDNAVVESFFGALKAEIFLEEPLPSAE